MVKYGKYQKVPAYMKTTVRKRYYTASYGKRGRGKIREMRRHKIDGWNTIRVRKPPVPRCALVHFKYIDQIELDPAAQSGDANYFRANDLYDPDYTGAGHQPMGFDEWMTFYNHFCVIGSKCTARFLNQGSAATDDMVVGLYLNDDTSGASGLDETLEQPNTVYKSLAPLGMAGAIQTLSLNFSAKKFYCIKDLNANSKLKGSSAASPEEVAFFVVFCHSFGTTDNPTGATVTVQLDYYAVLSEQRTLTAS